jgi:hypothetical protein
VNLRTEGDERLTSRTAEENVTWRKKIEIELRIAEEKVIWWTEGNRNRNEDKRGKRDLVDRKKQKNNWGQQWPWGQKEIEIELMIAGDKSDLEDRRKQK